MSKKRGKSFLSFLEKYCENSPIYNHKKSRTTSVREIKRAIDGARTRGLDLGKVARYQLRHYRICPVKKCTPHRQDIYYQI